MLFRIDGGLPHDTARTALRRLGEGKAFSERRLGGVNDGGVYWVEITDPAQAATFTRFLGENSVQFDRPHSLPDGRTSLRPRPARAPGTLPDINALLDLLAGKRDRTA